MGLQVGENAAFPALHEEKLAAQVRIQRAAI